MFKEINTELGFVSLSYSNIYISRVRVYKGWNKALEVTKTHHTNLWMQKYGFVVPQHCLE